METKRNEISQAFDVREVPLDSAVKSLLFDALFGSLQRPGCGVVRPGEAVRALIVVPTIGVGRAVVDRVREVILSSPIIAKLIQSDARDSIVVRRPDGRDISVLMVRSQENYVLRGTWLAGALFCETRHFDACNGASALVDSVGAAAARLLPGTSIHYASME